MSVAVIDSAPSRGVYYFWSLTLSVCPSVCLSRCFFKSIPLFFVSWWNRAIFWPSFLYVAHSTKLFSSIFDVGPHSPKFTPQNLHVSHWVSQSVDHGLCVNDIWARHGVQSPWLVVVMSPLRRHIFVCFMAKSAFWRGFSALAPYTGVGPI